MARVAGARKARFGLGGQEVAWAGGGDRSLVGDGENAYLCELRVFCGDSVLGRGCWRGHGDREVGALA
ncbi:hypothetical protein Ari01nite_44740 [Paractinoplanes rishiriensis]|uniref:Uncharacterized protein n=1 Tax=Paractinoplanes rishiriensis TaxID=1050105 RepID=A0A919K1B5_9ACTN|nr:hypothetical protein Ari01nite_44740 [Actinoplanes rishiriensis]